MIFLTLFICFSFYFVVSLCHIINQTKLENMKKTLMAIVAILFALASFGQTDVYRSARFNANSYGFNSEFAGLLNSTYRTKTIEMWVKRDTIPTSNEYLLHTSTGVAGGTTSTGTLAGIYLKNTDTTLHFVWCNNDIQCAYTIDTDWHHIAVMVDMLGTYDTTSIYVDGVFQSGGKFVNTILTAGPGSTPTSYLGAHMIDFTTFDNYYYGNMSKLVICDSILYTSTFVPDCVFDSIGFWTGGSISAPYHMLIPLSYDNHIYHPAYLYPYVDSINIFYAYYTYGTSPCAPIYSFYCPALGTDSATLVAVQSNKSYKKGANMMAHNNGWNGSSTSITYGNFTDTMNISLLVSGSYPYTNDYHYTVDTTIVITTTGVKDVYNVNDIKVFPNPSTGDINIQVTDPVTLTICDLTGHIVYNANVADKTMIHLSQGMYICTTTNKITNVVHSAKILIQ